MFTKRFTHQVLAIACIATTVHALLLACFISYCRANNTDLYMGTDTGTYMEAAKAIGSDALMPAAFRTRVALPFLFFVAKQLSADPTIVLWFLLPLHFLTVLSLAFLAQHLTKSDATGLVAAMSYLVYPGVYHFSGVIGTDLPHAQLATIAIAATMLFTASRHTAPGILAACFWPLTQLFRPTAFLVAPLLIIALWPALRTRGGNARGLSITILLMSSLVPTYWTISNHITYGVASPSLQSVELVHRCVTPSMRMHERHDADPTLRFSTLWEEEREVIARQDTRYNDLRLYEGGIVSPQFEANYKGVMEDNLDYVRSRPLLLARCMYNQLRTSIISHRQPRIESFQFLDEPLRRLNRLGLLTTLLGAMVILRKKRLAFALFSAGYVAMILLPASLSWWGGYRFRLPVDLLALVYIAAALTNVVSIAACAGIGLLAYLPFRLFRLPELFIHAMTFLLLVFAGWAQGLEPTLRRLLRGTVRLRRRPEPEDT